MNHDLIKRRAPRPPFVISVDTGDTGSPPTAESMVRKADRSLAA
jgi:hypothetical protein